MKNLKSMLSSIWSVCAGLGIVILLTGSDAQVSAGLLIIAFICLLAEHGMMCLDDRRRGL